MLESNWRFSRRWSRSLGFTLIEILVVVAIIALLVAILLPSLQRARNQAKAVVCLTGLKQVGSAMIFYDQDNKGFLPPYRMVRPFNNNPNDPQNFPYWFQYLPFKYLSGNYEVDRCPTDDLKDVSSPSGGLRGPYVRLVHGSSRPGAANVYYSYCTNWNMPIKSTPVYPSSMLLSGEDPYRFNPGRSGLVRVPSAFAYLLESRSSGLLNPNSPLNYFRYEHGGPPTKMNILFADSHAEPRDIKTIWPGDFVTQLPKYPDPTMPGGGKFCAFWFGNPTAKGPADY